MMITYKPDDRNNFHRAKPITLRVSGEMHEKTHYTISRYQARRVWDHFCGIRDCYCPNGGLEEITEGQYGLDIKFCSTKC